MNQYTRHTAYLVRVGELLEGQQLKHEEGSPTLFFIPKRQLRLSRANLVGFVIGKENNGTGYEEFTLDDGSGTIPVRNFDTSLNLNSLKIGDCINLIGRVRDYNGVRYIIPEIVRRVNRGMLKLRELELKSVNTEAMKPLNDKKQPEKEHTLDETSPKQQLYEMIKELDKGEGVDIQTLHAQSRVADVDRIIKELIEEGEIFKVSPARVKSL